MGGENRNHLRTSFTRRATTTVQFFEYFTNENSIKFILDFVLFFMFPFAVSNRSAIVFVETEDALSIAYAMRTATANKKITQTTYEIFVKRNLKKIKKERNKSGRLMIKIYIANACQWNQVRWVTAGLKINAWHARSLEPPCTINVLEISLFRIARKHQGINSQFSSVVSLMVFAPPYNFIRSRIRREIYKTFVIKRTFAVLGSHVCWNIHQLLSLLIRDLYQLMFKVVFN